MRNHGYAAWFVWASLLGLPTTAAAHLLVTAPTPRVADDNIKENRAPCGGPRGDTIHQLTGGEPLTLEFDETIAHPGHFELRFSESGDANWQMLDANIPDQGGVGSYTHTFDVPMVACTDCTLQFVQVMTDRNPPTNYYNCIDVEIVLPTEEEEDVGTAADVGVPDAGATPDVGTPGTSDTGMSTNMPMPPTNPMPPAPNDPTLSEPDRIEATGTMCTAAAGSTPMGDWCFAAVLLVGVRRARRTPRTR